MSKNGWSSTDKEYMLMLEHGNCIAYAMVMEAEVILSDGSKVLKEIFRGCIFCGNSNDPPYIVAKPNKMNCNFNSFHEVCKRIEQILNVRRDQEPPEENILDFLGG